MLKQMYDIIHECPCNRSIKLGAMMLWFSDSITPYFQCETFLYLVFEDVGCSERCFHIKPLFHTLPVLYVAAHFSGVYACGCLNDYQTL